MLKIKELTKSYGEYKVFDGPSRRMKQRICLARCLIHNPLEYVFMIITESEEEEATKA